MAEISRATLRRKLKSTGIPIARNRTYADGITIVEFIDYWGIIPGAPGTGAETRMVVQALKHLKLYWRLGNMPLVYKDQPDWYRPVEDIPRPIQGTLL